MALTEKQRAQRNQHPHAEARLAMTLWSHEYAFEQRGGSMDFWDSLDDRRKRLCFDTVSEVLASMEDAGRWFEAKAASALTPTGFADG